MHEDMHVVPFRVYPHRHRTLRAVPKAFELQKLPEGTVIVTIAGSETRMAGANFSGLLPNNESCMVFDSTCAGLTISDSLVTGGLFYSEVAIVLVY